MLSARATAALATTALVSTGVVFGLLPDPIAPAPAPGAVVPGALAAPVAAPVATPVVHEPYHVVVISEDGLRPDVLSDALTPRHMKLMREGTTAAAARTIRHSDTLPSHAAMLSGADVTEHGLWWNSYKADRGFINVPTVFSVARRAGLSTAMIVGKPKLRHIAIPHTVDTFERPSYLCGGVAKRAAAFFKARKPDLLFVHFSDPDEYGHSHGWMSTAYRKAVANSDKCLTTLLAAIDSSDIASRTVVIVTADHGGHGHYHSGKPGKRGLADRTIPWIIRGPGIDPGALIHDPIETIDTASTILAALGLPPEPTMKGMARMSNVRMRNVTANVRAGTPASSSRAP